MLQTLVLMKITISNFTMMMGGPMGPPLLLPTITDPPLGLLGLPLPALLLLGLGVMLPPLPAVWGEISPLLPLALLLLGRGTLLGGDSPPHPLLLLLLLRPLVGGGLGLVWVVWWGWDLGLLTCSLLRRIGCP